MDLLPNAAEAQLAETIRQVGRPGFAAALHDWLRRCLATDNFLVLGWAEAGPPAALYAQADAPAAFAQLGSYLAGAYLLDPFHELNLRRVPRGVYRLSDVAPDAFRRSRYFRDYYRRTTIIDELTVIAYPVSGGVLNLCLGRDATSERRFAAREIEMATRLAPVIAALGESHWADLAAGPRSGGDLPGALRAALAARGIAISPRQAEVALLILRGHSSGSIALRLGVSAATVKVFRRQLYGRCGISSQAELFALLMPLVEGGALGLA